MKILVTGGAGQLAQAVRREWAGLELCCPDETQLNLTDQTSIREQIRINRPQVVLNLGAFTQVDLCETNEAQAMLVNGTAVGWLAEACADQKALLVQISTDYVFDGTGDRPYTEEDPTHPRSAYGRSKLLGETMAAQAPEHLIIRTAWLYDAWGKNFLRAMLRAAQEGRSLKVVDDQTGTPTTCRALARQLRTAVEENWRGLVHGTCQGQTSWHGFAVEIFRQAKITADIRPCSTADYPLPAPRPAYSVLSGEHRKCLGTDCMPGWVESLAEVIADIS